MYSTKTKDIFLIILIIPNIKLFLIISNSQITFVRVSFTAGLYKQGPVKVYALVRFISPPQFIFEVNFKETRLAAL